MYNGWCGWCSSGKEIWWAQSVDDIDHQSPVTVTVWRTMTDPSDRKLGRLGRECVEIGGWCYRYIIQRVVNLTFTAVTYIPNYSNLHTVHCCWSCCPATTWQMGHITFNYQRHTGGYICFAWYAEISGIFSRNCHVSNTREILVSCDLAMINVLITVSSNHIAINLDYHES